MRRLPLAVVTSATLAAGLTACSGGEPSPAPAPSASSTPLADYATGSVTVARDEFCARIAPAAIEQALGGAATAADSWVNGERAEVAPGVTDVAHEYGCTWQAADGQAVRAWVFAPPVTPGQANALQRAATKAKGCDRLPDAPRFGNRTVAVRCDTTDGAVVSFHGLFGDAWLSCSLEGADGTDNAALLDRAGRWCVTVVQAAAA